MKDLRPTYNSTIITFRALEYGPEIDTDLVDLLDEHEAPNKIVMVSLKLDVVKEYKQSEFEGLTELVTHDGDIYIIQEEWGLFNWRFECANGQDPERSFENLKSDDGLITIRTYNN